MGVPQAHFVFNNCIVSTMLRGVWQHDKPTTNLVYSLYFFAGKLVAFVGINGNKVETASIEVSMEKNIDMHDGIRSDLKLLVTTYFVGNDHWSVSKDGENLV